MGRTTTARIRDPYLDLVRRFPLRPIRSEKELDEANAVIHSLISRELEPAEQDYLDVLSDLVERYEEQYHPIERVRDVEVLRHLMESREENQRQVARGAGISVSTICDILAGRRKMNRFHIEKLSTYFNVDPGVFLTVRQHRGRRTKGN